MNSSAEQKLSSYLELDERLLWTGIPAKRLEFQTSDYAGFAMGLVGIAFLGSGVFQAATNSEWIMLLFLIPFSTVWISGAAGQPFFRAFRRRRHVYGLTSRRVLILRGSSIQSISLAAIPNVAYEGGSGSTGTVTFGTVSSGNRRGELSPPAFELINNGLEVYRLVRETQNQLIELPQTENVWARR